MPVASREYSLTGLTPCLEHSGTSDEAPQCLTPVGRCLRPSSDGGTKWVFLGTPHKDLEKGFSLFAHRSHHSGTGVTTFGRASVSAGESLVSPAKARANVKAAADWVSGRRRWGVADQVFQVWGGECAGFAGN